MTLKEILNRIKCKLFVCCKITCNEALDKLENEIEEVIEETEEYDYYSNKVKNFKKKRSSSV